jgi:2C-methyl-D-erythritol 2,4-cyclodiphosphate synthase
MNNEFLRICPQFLGRPNRPNTHIEALENKTTNISVTIRITRPKFEPDILQTHNQIITAVKINLSLCLTN